MKDMKSVAEPAVKPELEDDVYMEKYGYPEHEVSYCYNTIKQAKEIEKNPKKMAAISFYAKEEMGEAEKVLSSLEEMEEVANKAKGKPGVKDYYNDETKKNDYEEERDH